MPFQATIIRLSKRTHFCSYFFPLKTKKSQSFPPSDVQSVHGGVFWGQQKEDARRSYQPQQVYALWDKRVGSGSLTAPLQSQERKMWNRSRGAGEG